MVTHHTKKIVLIAALAFLTFGIAPKASADNPIPTITSINPSSILTGASAFSLVIKGTNFVSTSQVWLIPGAQVPSSWVAFNSSSQLTINFPAKVFQIAGAIYSVQAFNPAPGGGWSNPATFAVGSSDFSAGDPPGLLYFWPTDDNCFGVTTFQWTFNVDPSAQSLSAFVFQMWDKSNNALVINRIYDGVFPVDPSTHQVSNSQSMYVYPTQQPDSLVLGHSYGAKVLVIDNLGRSSGFITYAGGSCGPGTTACSINPTYTTFSHLGPQVSFTYSPSNPIPNSPVSFADNAACSNASGVAACTAWNWTFGNGDTSTLQNPSETYTAEGNYTVTETATDAENNSCQGSNSVSVGNVGNQNAPKEIETSPTDNSIYTSPAFCQTIAPNPQWVDCSLCTSHGGTLSCI